MSADKALLLNVIGPALIGSADLTSNGCTSNWNDATQLSDFLSIDATADGFVTEIHMQLFCNASGSLPVQLNQLPQLQMLQLSGNPYLRGDLSMLGSWANMSQMEYLALDSCAIEGILPTIWGVGMTRLEHLILSQTNVQP